MYNNESYIAKSVYTCESFYILVTCKPILVGENEKNMRPMRKQAHG